MFQEELHFFPDSSCIRYSMTPPKENKIALIRIYAPMSYEIKGDTILVFATLNNLKFK